MKPAHYLVSLFDLLLYLFERRAYCKRQILFQRLEVKMSQLMVYCVDLALGWSLHDLPSGRRHHRPAFAAIDYANESLLRLETLEHFERSFTGKPDERSAVKSTHQRAAAPDQRCHRWWLLSQIQTKWLMQSGGKCR